MARTIVHDKRTKSKKQAVFLQNLLQFASVTRAAKSTKIGRQTVYDWLKNDASFVPKYEEACEIATASLEDEAIRRAHEGTLKPVFQGGKKVGTVREYSDTLLIILLKARSPEKYKDRFSGELTGKGGGPIKTDNVSKHEIVFKKFNGDNTTDV